MNVNLNIVNLAFSLHYVFILAKSIFVFKIDVLAV